MEIKGLGGFIIMNSLKDPQDTVVLTFWKTKQDMDEYHTLDNKLFARITEKIKPIFEHIPERRDYIVFNFKISSCD